MNKYKNLISNTLVFAIATFSTKLLPFVLMRLYTELLSKTEYGVQELVTTTCNLILPVMYLSMGEAVIRYGLDGDFRKRDVFTTAVVTTLAGYAVLWCVFPLLKMIPLINEYLWLIYLYTIASAMHTVAAQFVRASGLVRLFAIDGIYTTLMTVAMNILLLVYFQMGAEGYVLSIIIADASSAVLLTLVLKLYRFFKPRGINWGTVRTMLRYSIPLVPTAVFWWVTTLSNRYFVNFMCGTDAVGIYTVAQKLPNLILLVSMIFTQAWQISAFTEYDTPEGAQFYSNVFKSYYTFIFLAASGLILVCKPVIGLMSAEDFHSAWQYVPFLVLAVAFSTLVTFLGTIYNAVEKNSMVMLTTFIAAVVNIALNWLLIPRMGPQGAAVATFASYFIAFAIRAVDSRKHIRIQMEPVRLVLNLGLLLLQTGIALAAPPFWALWEVGILFAIIACNFKHLLFLVKHLYAMVFLKKAA